MTKNIKLQLYTIGILIIILSPISFLIVKRTFIDYDENPITNKKSEGYTENPPTIVKSSYLKVSPILINGNDEWAIIAETKDWCTGSGTSSNPYIIKNLEINAAGGNYCFLIKNSDVYFIIRNCKGH